VTAGEAYGAVELVTCVANARISLSDPSLCNRDLLGRVKTLRQTANCRVSDKARAQRVYSHVGASMLDSLKAPDRAIKLLAVLHLVESKLKDPFACRRHLGTTPCSTPPRDHGGNQIVTSMYLSEKLLGTDLHSLEGHDVVVIAVDRLDGSDGDSRSFGIYDKEGAALGSVTRASLEANGHEKMIGDVRVGNEELFTGNFIPCPVGSGCTTNRFGPPASASFEVCIGENHGPGCDRRQIGRALRIGAELIDGTAAEQDCRKEGRWDPEPRELFENEAGSRDPCRSVESLEGRLRHVRQILFGEGCPESPSLRKLLPKLA
jgi:hypothetical protein